VSYLAKTLWPRNLAVFYPHPADGLPLGQVVAAAVLLVGVTALAVAWRKRCPYLAVGWLWYLGTLVPVIGLVQVGEQALADRYTYVPLVGLFIALVWGAADLLTWWRCPAFVQVVWTAAVLLALIAGTRIQLRHWRTSIALWAHALRVTAGNYVAHNNLGIALWSEGQVEPAAQQFAAAVEAHPHYALAYNNWGELLFAQGKTETAVDKFRVAAGLKPDAARYRYYLACALQEQGRVDQARAEYDEAQRLDPTWPEAVNRKAWVYAAHPAGYFRDGDAALFLAKQACQATGGRDPHFLDTLAAAYAEKGSFREAISTARAALREAASANRPELAPQIQEHLRVYEACRPFRSGRTKGE
jgi:Flp pilus assembly protein TadD